MRRVPNGKLKQFLIAGYFSLENNLLFVRLLSKEFGRGSHLKQHVDAVHRQEKPFQCDVCLKVKFDFSAFLDSDFLDSQLIIKILLLFQPFSRKQHLLQHFKVHSSSQGKEVWKKLKLSSIQFSSFQPFNLSIVICSVLQKEAKQRCQLFVINRSSFPCTGNRDQYRRHQARAH